MFGSYEQFEPDLNSEGSGNYRPSSLNAEANDDDENYQNPTEQLNELIDSDNDDEFDLGSGSKPPQTEEGVMFFNN